MANPETCLHVAALDYLRAVCPDCLVFHVPNGGKRSKETARLMKRLGLMPGVFDLTMILPDGRHFYLEAKVGRNDLTEDQETFKKELILRGIPYVVFRNLGDIETFVQQNNVPNRLAIAA
jgi:uncharacterized protein (UPF0261 family)